MIAERNIDTRSDREVVVDTVRGSGPDTLFSYGELEAALRRSVDDPVPRDRICRAVATANAVLLKEEQRCLVVVRNEGYRIARSEEHVAVALGRRRRAHKQMRKGVATVGGTKLEELTEEQRRINISVRMCLADQEAAIAAHSKQLKKHQAAIEGLFQHVGNLGQRVEELEKAA